MRCIDVFRVKAPIAIIGTVGALLPLLGDAATRDVRGNSRNSTDMATKISIPPCGSMEQIAAGINADDQVPINRWQGGLTITAGIAAPEFERAFGQPMLSWTRADFNVFNPAATDCMKAAAKAKRSEPQRQLVELRRVVKYHLSKPLNSVNRARQEVKVNMDSLEAQPTSTDKLKIVALLSQLQNLSQQAGATQVRRPIEQMRDPAATPGRLIAHSIQNLPQVEANIYFARIDAHRDELVEQVLADLDQNLSNAPASVAGLIAVDGTNAAAQGLSGYVPEDSLAKLMAEAEQARQGVWIELERSIESAPSSSEGGQQLDAILGSEEYNLLGVEDRMRLSGLVTAQREQMAGAVVNSAVEELESFPATIDGIRQLVSFAVTQRRQLARQNTRGASQPFEDAYRDAHQSRIESVRSEFEDFLEEVPMSRAGVAQIRTTLRETDAPRNSSVYQAGLTRAKEIASTVAKSERQQQCHKVLPGIEWDDDDSAQLVMGFSGDPLILGELLCDIALAGNKVHGYEGPGFFDEDHQLQITGRDGIYRTYILNPAPIGPDQEALVGVRVIDPTKERALDVNQWRSTLATLLPANKAGRKARCAQLMQTPDSQLSAEDRMEAIGCVMGSMLGE